MKSSIQSKIVFAVILLWAAMFSFSAQAIEQYKPGLIKAALAKGETVFVEYYAPWCPTCRAQASVIRDILSENPDYDEKIRFVRVDWDTYRNSEIAKKYKVRRQSTLVMLKGKKVLGKLVAKTSRSEIAGLIKKGV